MLVICVNAIWITVDVDYNDAQFIIDSDWHYQAVEYFFLLFFSAELAIKFVAYENRREIYLDYWYLFDSLLVFLMLVEIFIVPFIFKEIFEEGEDSSLFRSLAI